MPVIGRRNYPSEGTVITQQIGVTRLSTIEIHHIKMQVKKFFDNKNSRQLSEMPPRAPQKYYRPLPMEEEVNSYRQVRSKVFIGSICKSVGKAIRKIFSRSKVIPVKLEPASDSAKLENSAKCGMDQNLPINRILYERTVIDFMISTYNMMNGQVSSLFMEELDNRIRSYDWLVPRPVYYHLSTKGAPPTTKLEDLNVTNKIQPRNTVKMENLEKDQQDDEKCSVKDTFKMNDLLETIRKNFEQLEVSSATSNDTFESFGKCRNLTRKISHKAKDYYGLTEEETTPSPSNDCRDQNRTSSFFSKNNSTQPDLIPRISIELISSNDFLTANHISRESSFVSKCVGVDIMPMIGHANSDTLKCREYEKSKHVNEDLASFEKYFPMNQKFLDLETNETNEQNALISNVKNETLRLDVYENLSSHADEMKPKPYGLKYTEYIGENYSLPEKNLVSYDSGIDSGEVETLYEVFTNRSAYSMSFGDIDVVKRQELEDFSASRLSKPKYISCGDIGMTSSGNSSASQNKRRLGAKVGMLVAIFEEHPPSESANASIY